MIAKQCDMPATCAFRRERGDFYHWDSFEVPLNRTDLNITRIYLGIFTHAPAWMKWMLVLRTKIVSLFGIGGPTLARIKDMVRKDKYAIGERIGLFTLYDQSEDEIIAGGDDKHLDFRVSLQKLTDACVTRVVLTTVLTTHNFFGKFYLFVILPFHRLGVKTLMSDAVAAQRL
jgi:hypothetical protein